VGIVLGGVVLAVLMGSLVPGLRRSARARSSGLFVIGLAIVFEGLVGLSGGRSWIDVAVIAAGAGLAAVNMRRYRLASAHKAR
jgi:hypothetical protein